MTGRQRRRLYEWEQLKKLLRKHDDIVIEVTASDGDGIPTAYAVEFHIHSISGVEQDGKPIFADLFTMELVLPEDYPQVDAPPRFRFVGDTLPWHPNIRYFGEMAGRVCLNQLNTFADLAWGVERISLYLRYELYHALQEPPYPEDLKVAEWVRHIGEPNNYVFFDQ